MPVAARSDEHESRLRPFPGARPRRRGRWTAGARRRPIAFVTAVKAPNDRRRGSQFSSWNISLPHRRCGCAPFLCMALGDLTRDRRDNRRLGIPPKSQCVKRTSRALALRCGYFGVKSPVTRSLLLFRAPFHNREDRNLHFLIIVFPRKSEPTPQVMLHFAGESRETPTAKLGTKMFKMAIPGGKPDARS